MFCVLIGAYLLLTTNSVNRSLGDKFLAMTDQVALDYNLQNNNDYQLFSNVVNNNSSEE